MGKEGGGFWSLGRSLRSLLVFGAQQAAFGGTQQVAFCGLIAPADDAALFVALGHFSGDDFFGFDGFE